MGEKEKNIKILMVDDEADFVEPMAFWFKSKGYEMLIAHNGQDALKIVQDSQPDIIFMDLNMPVMDGITTIKRIREFNTEVPIIIISAYVDRLLIKEAEPFDISGVFYKGKDFEDGLSLIESVLRTHKRLKK